MRWSSQFAFFSSFFLILLRRRKNEAKQYKNSPIRFYYKTEAENIFFTEIKRDMNHLFYFQ